MWVFHLRSDDIKTPRSLTMLLLLTGISSKWSTEKLFFFEIVLNRFTEFLAGWKLFCPVDWILLLVWITFGSVRKFSGRSKHTLSYIWTNIFSNLIISSISWFFERSFWICQNARPLIRPSEKEQREISSHKPYFFTFYGRTNIVISQNTNANFVFAGWQEWNLSTQRSFSSGKTYLSDRRHPGDTMPIP